MSGYQEVLTDPSYARQIVTMTSPQQGNYGTNREDPESGRVQVAAFVVRGNVTATALRRIEDLLTLAPAPARLDAPTVELRGDVDAGYLTEAQATEAGLDVLHLFVEPKRGVDGAALAAKEHFKNFDGDILIVFGDTPMVVQVRSPSVASINTRVTAPVADDESRMRTL